MLTPMMVQYLVGLCCLRHNPEAVDITVGNMVFDAAAEKERDVDITVTIEDENGCLSAFMGVEVKHEAKPLGVGTIEQLTLKMADMPAVTHKSIFSTSGYTDGAKAKATAHSVDLYSLKPWESNIEEHFPDFTDVKTPSEFLAHVESSLLYWANSKVFLVVPDGPSKFSYENTTPVLSVNGKQHNKFKNMQQYLDAVLFRSCETLCTQEPATTIMNTFPFGIISDSADFIAGPPWPHTHTLDTRQDRIFLQLKEEGLYQIEAVTISGHLQWRKRKRTPEFFILENVSDNSIFAGAAIADYGVGDGRMFAMIVPDKGRTIGIHRFQLTEKQKNMIRNLKIQEKS